MERLRDIRVFIDSGMQLDLDERLLPPSSYRECWESIVNISAESNIGCLENIKGTTNVFALTINSTFTFPTGTFQCIGAKEDTEDNAIIYMLCDTVGANHCIMRMFVDNYRCEWIFRGESVLNFQPDHKITSIWRIGDLLGWTDDYEGTPFVDYNPPRKVNIVKATAYTNPFSLTKTYYPKEVVSYGGKSYRFIYQYPGYGALPTNTAIWEVANVGVYSALTNQILDRIKYPPVYAPTVTYDTDTDYAGNNLRGHLFQAAYRYVYDDNEKSVFSPISDIALPTNIERLNGSYDETIIADNVLNIDCNSGTAEASHVEIIIREGNTGVWRLIKRLNKYEEDGTVIFTNDDAIQYQFYNNEVGEAIDQKDVETLFDAVPQISAHEKLIEKNRIIDGNYIEGFDNTDIDVSLTVVPSLTSVGKIGDEFVDWSLREIAAILPFPIPFGDGIQFAFYGGRLDFNVVDSFGNSFWEPGFTYVINISATPYTYSNVEGLEGADSVMPLIYQSYENKKIAATAVVDATGMILGDFMDAVVSQLRSGTSLSSVIAYNNFSYKTFNSFSSLYDAENGNTIPVVGDSQLGFILEFAGSSPNMWAEDCVTESSVTVDVLKLSGRTVVQSFKSGAFHQFGIVYKDRAGRRSFVNVSDDSKIYVPAQNSYPTPVHEGLYKNDILLEISNVPPLSAVTYQPVYAKNTSIDYFLFASIASISNTSYSPGVSGSSCTLININEYIIDTVETFPKFNIKSYIWESGDRIRFILIRDGNLYFNLPFSTLDFEILGTYFPTGDASYEKDKATSPAFVTDANGNKIPKIGMTGLLVNRFNFSSYGIEDDKIIVEIYRPKKSSENLVYYDFGQPLPILDPGTSNRRHYGTTASQTIYPHESPAKILFDRGDVYISYRQMHNPFPCERSNFSDYYDSESFGIGKVNIENTNARRNRYISNLLYGGMYIENTLTNDLSKVKSSDYVPLAEKYGEINLIEEVGYTLKVLQKYKPTSLFIGMEGLKQANILGLDLVASKDAVLSKPVPSETDYGTTLTSGCVKYLRNIYFSDLYNGAIVRDAPNGIFPISDYGIKNYIRQKFQTFISHGVDNITAYSTYDEKYNLVFFSFIDSIVPAENFTVAFHEPTNKWISFYSFIPDYYGCLGSVLTSFKGSGLWLHDSGTRMNYYGVQYEQMVKIVANKDPLKVKAFKAIVVDSNKAWNAGTTGDILITANGSLTRGASSKLPEAWFELREGKYYSNFGRNMLSSGSTESNDDLINGDELRGSSMSINLRNASTDETRLFGVIIDSAYSPKSGGQ